MKTVTGGVIGSHPISISRASSILSKFASSENGATQAVSAYLRRASAAFNELKGLHRELKASNLKEKKPRSDVTLERNPTLGSDEPSRPDYVSRGTYDGLQKKKHKKKEKQSGGVVELVENREEGENVDGGEVTTKLEAEEEPKKEERKEKMKRKSNGEASPEEKKSKTRRRVKELGS